MPEQLVPAGEQLAVQHPADALPVRRLTPLDVASGVEADLRERRIPFIEDQGAFDAFAAELRAEAARDTRAIPTSTSV